METVGYLHPLPEEHDLDHLQLVQEQEPVSTIRRSEAMSPSTHSACSTLQHTGPGQCLLRPVLPDRWSRGEDPNCCGCWCDSPPGPPPGQQRTPGDDSKSQDPGYHRDR